jgi:ribonuclease Z
MAAPSAAMRGIAPDVWALHWIGTGGYGSQPQLGMPSAFVTIGGERHLFNVGDGTYARLSRLAGLRSPTAIWLASCHNEFVGGLATLLDWLAMSDQRPLPTVYGPSGLGALASRLQSNTDVELDQFAFREFDASQSVLRGAVRVTCTRVGEQERFPAYGFRLSEPDWRGHFDVAAASALGITGSAFERLEQGHAVNGVRPEDVLGPERRGRRLALAWIGRPSPAMRALAENAQVFCVAAPFIDERAELARDMDYCTGVEAAMLASQSGVDMVALHHVGRAVPIGYARTEAAQFHSHVVTPRAGDRFIIPTPGSGPVRHEKTVLGAASKGTRPNRGQGSSAPR